MRSEYLLEEVGVMCVRVLRAALFVTGKNLEITHCQQRVGE